MLAGRGLATLKPLAVAMFATAFLICAATHSTAANRPQASSARDQAFVPGELVVKFKDSVTESAAALINERRFFHNSLDRLVSGYRVQHARPVFRTPAEERRLASEGLAALKQHQRGRVAAVKQRYPVRTGRAPQGAVIPDLSHVYVLELPEDADVRAAAAAFAADPHVEYASANYLVEVQLVPNDPYYSSSGSWGQPYDDLWGLKKIQAQQAWDVTQGAGTVVAVVDTGLDYNHPDIAQNVWSNAGEVPANGVDDDANGYADDVRGWDFVTYDGDPEDRDPMDGHGHGTHVSGTIAAVGNNSIGIIGVAPQAQIMPLKGLSDSGFGTSEDLARALRYAADNGADVINNSWGCGCPSLPPVDEAVRYAHALGAVVVLSAGNGGDNDVHFRSPQNKPETIVVSAFDQNDQPTAFTSFGLKVDVAAPGGGTDVPPPDFRPRRNVLSLLSAAAPVSTEGLVHPDLIVGEQYLRLAGTSMAAPHASGLAALVLARRPAFTNEEVRQVLRVSADDVDAPGFDVYSGRGRINAARALTVDRVLRASITAPASGAQFCQGLESIEVRGTAAGPEFASYQISYGAGLAPTAWAPVASSALPVDDGSLATWDASSLSSGEYSLRLEVTDAQGLVYDAHVASIMLENVPGSPLLGADRIAFEAESGGYPDIYVLDAVRTCTLTDGPRLPSGASASNVRPAFSPDGSRIAFMSNRNGNWDIYVMNADGTGLRRLTDNPEIDTDPAWSPDGKKIAFATVRASGWGIWVMNANGTGQTRLGDGDGDPAWSPDGSRIVFEDSVAPGPLGGEIFVMNTDGSAVRQLTDDPFLNLDPAWSPDGSKIAFARGDEAYGLLNDEIYVMNPDGSGETLLAGGSPDDDIQPAWSPDGSKLAFTNLGIEQQSYDMDIHIMNADGAARTEVTTQPSWDHRWPSWGRQITDGDSDSLPDYGEAANGTNPLDPDSDDDGLPDGSEIYEHATDPLDADTDNDGLADGPEVTTYRTDPAASDTDNDALSDGAEVLTYGTDPLDIDSDDDGLTDGEEINTYRTNPLVVDSDRDSCGDSVEIASNAARGGRRDPNNFWDFFDVPAGSPPARDRAVSGGDINGVVKRFGSNDSGAGAFDRNSDPLSTPSTPVTPSGVRANYHPAYDRGGSFPGQDPWDLQPPNGSITGIDINSAVVQFGHNCA